MIKSVSSIIIRRRSIYSFRCGTGPNPRHRFSPWEQSKKEITIKRRREQELMFVARRLSKERKETCNESRACLLAGSTYYGLLWLVRVFNPLGMALALWHCGVGCVVLHPLISCRSEVQHLKFIENTVAHTATYPIKISLFRCKDLRRSVSCA